MIKNLNVSVAMTTFNGERYVSEQMNSIIAQLEARDELIIGDDGSTDNTLQILEQFAAKDSRIKMLKGNGNSIGIVKNFERVIKACTNDLILLSDQDDVWVPNKVEVIKEYFEKDKGLSLMMSDLIVVNQALETMNESYIKMRGCSTGILRNIIKNGYVGCALAFRRELKEFVLPFPKGIPMHDQWIGIVAEMFGKSIMIEEKLLLYRRYEDNATSLMSNSSPVQKVIWRLKLSVCLMVRKLSRRGSMS